MMNTFTTNLVTDAFMNCESLNSLSISDVNIPNVPEGFAQSCSNTKFVWLYNAGIQTIDTNAFKGLTNMEYLYLMNNKLSCIPPDVFQNSPLLKEIHLNSNKIIAVDGGLFRNLPRLHIIHLGLNLISYLPLFDFTGSAAFNKNFAFFLPGNPVNAIEPTFCNFFNSRPANVSDLFDVPGFKCLPNTAQTSTILKSNCQTTMSTYLQKCYGNWTSAMSSSVPCSTSACAQYLWQQFLDFLKTRS